MPGSQISAQDGRVNLINANELSAFCDIFAERIEDDRARKWLSKRLFSYFIRERSAEFEAVNMTNLNQFIETGCIDTIPGWATREIREGRPVHYFDEYSFGTAVDGDQDPFADIELVIDWINLLPVVDRYWKKLDRISIPNAIQIAEKWQERLIAEVDDSIAEDPRGLRSAYRFKDGFFVVQLKSAAALLREGTFMRHCVADYKHRVASNKTDIYSLRDPNNWPHVTFEIRQGLVCQIKGKANSVPSERYKKYVSEFIQAKGYQFKHRPRLFGFFVFQERFYAHPDDVIEGLLNREIGADLPFTWGRDVYTLFGYIAAHRHEISDQAWVRFTNIFSPDVGAVRTRSVREKTLSLPGFDLRVIEVELPSAPYVLMRNQLLDPEIAKQTYKAAARELFQTVSQAPEALYRLKFSQKPLGRAVVQDLFELAGATEEYDQLKQRAATKKLTRAGKAMSEYRTATHAKTGSKRSLYTNHKIVVAYDRFRSELQTADVL